MVETLAIDSETQVDKLVSELASLAPPDAAMLVASASTAVAVEALRRTNPAVIQAAFASMEPDARTRLVQAAPTNVGRQWMHNRAYSVGTVGRVMNAAQFVCHPEDTVAEAVDRLRAVSKHAFVTYGFVTDNGALIGVLVMRELVLSDPLRLVKDIMIRNPFLLTADMTVVDAMQAVITRSYPEYPVCDEGGQLVGIVRGSRLFEQQAMNLSAQPGTMVGVDREERVSTPWPQSFRFRHPWLQLNLLTAFVAAGVVGAFQGTIDRVVLLAVFLPVLAGQSGNTGCQALAVTLRGMTLGHLHGGMLRGVVLKESLLGALNGALVGLTAAIGMFVIATMQGEGSPLRLAFIVLVSMTGACVISGAAGALIPIGLRRLGADPATASSIFLTTATDVASMGMFLSLATLLL